MKTRNSIAAVVLCLLAGMCGCTKEPSPAPEKDSKGNAEVHPPGDKSDEANLVRAKAPKDKTSPVGAAGRWDVQNSGVKDALYAVAALSDAVAVAVGANKTVLKTADGGTSWRRVTEADKRVDLGQVLFSKGKEGWTIEGDGGTILHTAGAGDTWESIPSPNLGFGGNVRTHAAFGSTYFYMTWGQSGPHLFRTSDAGKKWVEVTDKLPLGGFGGSTRLAFADLKHGYFVTSIEDGVLGRTLDGGKSWQTQKTEDKAGLDGPRICFVDMERGWYSLPNAAVYSTVDGGQNWTRQHPGHASGFLEDLHFTDAKLGHVLISSREVRRTSDGGKSWSVLGQLPGADNVHGLSFASSRCGWVVGNNGYIARYRGQ